MKLRILLGLFSYVFIKIILFLPIPGGVYSPPPYLSFTYVSYTISNSVIFGFFLIFLIIDIRGHKKWKELKESKIFLTGLSLLLGIASIGVLFTLEVETGITHQIVFWYKFSFWILMALFSGLRTYGIFEKKSTFWNLVAGAMTILFVGYLVLW